MSTATAHGVPRFIQHPRETYLRQNEGRIRSEAARLAKNDPTISKHLSFVEFMEDDVDYHETIIEHFKKHDTPHRIPPHETYRQRSLQVKLHHLDQLANLIL